VQTGGDSEAGARLYATLFGGLPPRFAARRRWLLTLERELFAVPFAALVIDRGAGRPQYLAEARETVVVPGAAWLVAEREQGPAPLSAGPFVAVADPVYNTADPRWKSGTPARSWHDYLPGRLLAASRSPRVDATLVLPRLAASSAEARSCAAAWGGETTVLGGAEASRESVARVLAGRPAVLHFATHVLESGERPRHGWIALTLARNGEPELVGPREIAAWNASGTLVVLSGCSSGAGEALPAAGLMGLTRAWMAAGARAVAASHWPTADDSGSLFQAFYRQLRSHPEAGAAGALRLAQREAMRAGGWRAAPRYWGAYFVVGNH
jgi:CHAT domain-containing protein